MIRNIAMTPLSHTLVERLTSQLLGSGELVTTTAPATGDPVASLRRPTAEDVVNAYARARTAQRDWAASSPRQRSKPFVALHDLVLANDELIDVIQAETGKSRNSAFEDTLDIASAALYHGQHATEFLKPRKRACAIPLATKVRELRHPKGVISSSRRGTTHCHSA
jgi:acyl-CoA reductase-like NAD-dependent aldehyde dehydrogenase